ncbi:MAG: DJ-1/PfpI family protein [Prevotella sp.]|nr:DJ-1/PfpI family protein [Prevotella sp.]
MIVNIILFQNFETLDVFGPVEVFGKTDEWKIKFCSMNGNYVSNLDNVSINTEKIDNIAPQGVLFIPGGQGTRTEVGNTLFIDKLRTLAEQSKYVVTVCTGSALLAKTGLLDGKRATSNKRSFDWVKINSGHVRWVELARWVVDGKYYTSSGVSAGIDMALGFVADVIGLDKAREIAKNIEYRWQEDKTIDDFAH